METMTRSGPGERVEAERRGAPASPRAGGRLSATAEAHGAPAAARAISDLEALLAAPLASVEASLRAFAAGPRVSAEAARHLVRAGGKRVRPTLLLLAHRAAGGADGDPRPARLAAVSEALHGATLLHDDVIDQGEVRRGLPAARVVYGNSVSVLGGDLLLVRALEAVAAADPRGEARLLPSVLGVLARMIDAEALQLERRGSATLSIEEYFAIVEGKTASLFEWSARTGAALALPADDPRIEALARFGREVGVAFQVADDALDLAGDAALFGKCLLTDVREGKVTYPLIFSLRADPGLGAALEAAARGDLSADEARALFARASAAAVTGGGIAAARREVQDRTASARAALENLPPSPCRDALAAVAVALAERVR